MHRHLVMFASLFLFLWAAISIGCSGKNAEESSDSSAPSEKIGQFFWPERSDAPGRHGPHRAACKHRRVEDE